MCSSDLRHHPQHSDTECHCFSGGADCRFTYCRSLPGTDSDYNSQDNHACPQNSNHPTVPFLPAPVLFLEAGILSLLHYMRFRKDYTKKYKDLLCLGLDRFSATAPINLEFPYKMVISAEKNTNFPKILSLHYFFDMIQ